MSSLSGIVGSGYVANYAATKAYITTFSRGLYAELFTVGVDVVSCVAGATVTPTYLTALGNVSTRKLWIEQTTDEVVGECLSALGATSAVATGWLGKVTQTLFAQLLPKDVAIRMFSEQTALQIGHDPSTC